MYLCTDQQSSCITSCIFSHGNINSCVTELAVGQQEAEVWPEVGLQCAHTHNVGHALLIGLLGQNVSSGTDSASQVRRGYSDHWEIEVQQEYCVMPFEVCAYPSEPLQAPHASMVYGFSSTQ